MVGKATPERGGPRKSPDGVDPKTSGWASKRTRKTQRDGHNSGVKIWSLCSVSSILSHANLQQPFRNPCNKVRGKYIWNEVFLRLYPASFLPVSSSCVFLRASLLLSRYDTANEYITVGAHIERRCSRSRGEDVTITDVIIKTTDRKWDWGCKWRHARKRWAEEFGWFLKKSSYLRFWPWRGELIFEPWRGQASWVYEMQESCQCFAIPMHVNVLRIRTFSRSVHFTYSYYGYVTLIQTTALLRSARILRRVLETWGDLSLKLQWKTIG